MRKLLTLAASTVALTGASIASAAVVDVTFTGTTGAVSSPGNTSIPASPIGAGGNDFTITLNYDDVADQIVGATIVIDEDSDDAEIIRASVLNVDAGTSSASALDMLEIDLVSTNGDLAGNFSLDFEFFNTALNDESLGGALAALGDMGSIICSHIMFNFGGFKFEGTLDADGIVIENPVGEIPLPGAAVFMLSGLAAAGVARRRRA